jgi:DNA repair protein RecO (recombination protein O)
MRGGLVLGLYRTEAVVLRARELGETDRLLVLYTRSEGKVRAVAKGVRRPGSRLAGLEPFTLSELQLFQGRELDRVIQSQPRRGFRPLREDLGRLAAASYLAELVEGLTAERDPSPALFQTLVAGMALLAQGPDPLLALRFLELRLSALAGFQPVLDRCARCGGEAGPRPAFAPAEGGVVCAGCRPVSGAVSLAPGTLASLRFLAAAQPGRVEVLRLTAGANAEMARALVGWVSYHLERRPRSLDFLEALYLDAPRGLC